MQFTERALDPRSYFTGHCKKTELKGFTVFFFLKCRIEMIGLPDLHLGNRQPLETLIRISFREMPTTRQQKKTKNIKTGGRKRDQEWK